MKNNSKALVMKKKRKQQKFTPKTLAVFRPSELKRMSIYDSEGFIRLFEDPKSNLFIIFNGELNVYTHTTSYQKAQRIFSEWVELTINAKKQS